MKKTKFLFLRFMETNLFLDYTRHHLFELLIFYIKYILKKQQIIKISSDRGNFLISLVDAFDKIINLMKETDGMKKKITSVDFKSQININEQLLVINKKTEVN